MPWKKKVMVQFLVLFQDMLGEPPWSWHQWMPKYVRVTISLWFNIYNTEHRNILKHDQQDATLYNTLYYCQRSTCFERFFCSSSGAQICTRSIRYLSNLFAVTTSGPMNIKFEHRKLVLIIGVRDNGARCVWHHD